MGRKDREGRAGRESGSRRRSADATIPLGWAGLACMLLPVAAAWWTYRNALDGQFVFDDVPTVSENLSLVTLGGFWDAAFGEKHSPISNRPVVCFTFCVNYALGGLNPRGYHVFSLAVHMANAALLWTVLRRTLLTPNLGESFDVRRATAAATCIAAVWAVHPLGSEAVTYITQRTTLVMSFFLLAMFYAVLRSATDEPRRGLWKFAAVAACALAMMSKEEAVGAPFLVVLFDRAFLYPSFAAAWRERAGLYLSLAATWVLLAACVFAGPHNPTIGFYSVPKCSGWEWLLTESPVIVRYLQLTLWPQPLCAAYDWDILRSPSQMWTQGLFVLGLLIGSVALWMWRPHWGFLAAWFFILLAPTSSIVPIISEVVAERRMYLPMLSTLVPVLLAIGWLIDVATKAIFGALSSRWFWFAAPLAGLLYVESTAAARHAAVFIDEYTMWTDVRQKNELKNNGFLCASLLSGYAKVLLDRRRHEEAIPLLKQAVYDCTPSNSGAAVNLAAAYVDLGKLDEAEKLYQSIFADPPSDPNAYANYSNFLVIRYQQDPPEKQLGADDPRMQQAEKLLNHALQINPRNSNFWNGLGNVSFHLGKVDQAVQAWQNALKLNPASLTTLSNLGIVYAKANQLPQAVQYFEQLLAYDPQNLQTLLYLVQIYTQQGNRPLAAARLNVAAQIAPNDPQVRQLLQQFSAPTGGK